MIKREDNITGNSVHLKFGKSVINDMPIEVYSVHFPLAIGDLATVNF